LQVVSVSAAGEEDELLTGVALPAPPSSPSTNETQDPGSPVKDLFCSYLCLERTLTVLSLGTDA